MMPTEDSSSAEEHLLDAVREGLRTVREASVDPTQNPTSDRSVEVNDEDGGLVEIPFALEDVTGITTHASQEDESYLPPKITIDVDDIGRAALEAHKILLQNSDQEPTIHIESLDSDILKPFSAEEGRVLIRLRYMIQSSTARSEQTTSKSGSSTSFQSFVEGWTQSFGMDASLPWYIRHEAIRCLWADITKDLSMIDKNTYGNLMILVEGSEVDLTSVKIRPTTDVPPAQVRSAALRVISSHRHTSLLPRLITLCSRYDDNRNERSDSKTPLPGWFDGMRQLELVRALLGDISCYAALIGHLYDSISEHRTEAEDVMLEISKEIGGTVEVARRLILEDELLDERGQFPEFVGTPTNPDNKATHELVWKHLRDHHWNEIVVRWASKELKQCDI